MAENKPNLHAVTPSEFAAPEDAKDLDSLWVDPGLGDGITTANFHTVPVDKPKTFFRTHPELDLSPPHCGVHPQGRGCDRGAALYRGAGHARPYREGAAVHARVCRLP